MNHRTGLFAVTADDEEEALMKLRSDPRGTSAAYRTMIEEMPNLRLFLEFVRDKAGPATFQMLWLRIWAAMERDAAEGCARVIAALCEMPEFDRRRIAPAPSDPDKAVDHYASALEGLAERARP